MSFVFDTNLEMFCLRMDWMILYWTYLQSEITIYVTILYVINCTKYTGNHFCGLLSISIVLSGSRCEHMFGFSWIPPWGWRILWLWHNLRLPLFHKVACNCCCSVSTYQPILWSSDKQIFSFITLLLKVEEYKMISSTKVVFSCPLTSMYIHVCV